LYGLCYNYCFIGGGERELDRFGGGNKGEGCRRYLFDRRRARRILRFFIPIEGNRESGVEMYRYKKLKDVTTRDR